MIESEYFKRSNTVLQPELEGRSGCIIEVIGSSHGAYVEKTSLDGSYHIRLKCQYEKQLAFFSNQQSDDFFVTPNTYAFTAKNQRVSFRMDYIRGESYAQYFTRCSVKDIDYLIEKYLLFIENNLNKAVLVYPVPTIFHNKLEQIEKALLDKHIVTVFLQKLIGRLHEQIPTDPLPQGYSHGDMTFSNQIFTYNKVYLIDFLDSFISTPLNDFIKLRQDTKHFWTPFIDRKLQNYQRTKLALIFKYIDSYLLGFIESKQNYLNWTLYFEKLNLLRIVPYVTSLNEFEFIQSRLRSIETTA